MKRCATKEFKDATAGGGGLVRRPRWAVGTLAPQNLVIGARDNNLPRSSSGPMIEEVVENTAEAAATRKRAKRDEASTTATKEESKEVLPSADETTTNGPNQWRRFHVCTRVQVLVCCEPRPRERYRFCRGETPGRVGRATG